MADKHPYVTSGGPLIQVIAHLRKSFPPKINADTLKKLGYAPKNESYLINTLRYVGVIDEEGNKTESASKIFAHHDSNTFSKEFSKLVKAAYADLFSLHGDSAWELDSNALITFFRQTDQSGDIVGRRQADTFRALAGLCGYGELPSPRAKAQKTSIASKQTKATQKKIIPAHTKTPEIMTNEQLLRSSKGVGLTVRIEINLPAGGDQETYDRIFKSIRENLLNG